MRVPYSIRVAVFVLALLVLTFALKLTCPREVSGCLADYLTVPLFMPVAFVQKTFGTMAFGYEIVFLALYWTFVGFLIGLIFDLRSRQSQY